MNPRPTCVPLPRPESEPPRSTAAQTAGRHARAPLARALRGRRSGAAISLAVASLGAVTGSGCSMMFVDKPPARLEPGQALTCTTSYGLPVADGAVAFLGIATMLITLAAGHGGVSLPTAGLVTGATFTAVFGSSLAVGIDRVGGCREISRRELGRRPEAQQRHVTWGRNALVLEPSQEEEDAREAAEAEADAAIRRAAAASKAAGEAAGRATGAKRTPAPATGPSSP